MSTRYLEIAQDFKIDAVEYASRANAILGIRDSGKTFTGTKIAEQLLIAGIPVFVFDPIGRWRFLRVPAKGGRGFQVVVAGGAAPDLDLTPENVGKIVKAAMQTGVSVVLDLYSVKLSKKDWRMIVRNAIETILYESEGHGLRHVFLEEAAEFIPQRVRDGHTYSAVEKLARMGGNVGVGVTLINQRAEEVNKAVLELCDNLLLHRQRGKNSLLSLRKWLAAGNVDPPKEITDTLADLPTGECWAWFKDVGKPKRIKIAPKQSFDPNRRTMSLTTSAAGPKPVSVEAFLANIKAALAGKQPKLVVAPPPVAVAPRLSAKQEDQDVKESEAKALRAENKSLKDRVAALERALARPAADKSSPVVVQNTHNSAPAPDDLYSEFKRRLIEDGDPAVIRILTTKPEIEVQIERHVIQIDGSSLKGRVGRLVASGFFNDGATQGSTRAELRRTGPDVNTGNLSKTFAEYLQMGFLTLENGNSYRAVDGMKVNLVDAA